MRTPPVSIHPLAVVSPEAQLGQDVSVGPYSLIESGVIIGDRCQLAAHVVIKSGTTLGDDNRVAEYTVLGGAGQHIQPPARQGTLVIGARNSFREHVTVHRALHEGQSTVLGDDCLLMVGAHAAHDCRLENHVVIANGSMLGGHVTVGERAFVSGAVAVHQFCRVGRLAMVGGQAHVVQDVPPYVTIDGASSGVVGLNLVGLRRNGFSTQDLAQLKAAYRLIYRSGCKWDEVLAELRRQFPTGPAAVYHEFFATGRRGVIHERRLPAAATLKLRPLAPEQEEQEYRKAG